MKISNSQLVEWQATPSLLEWFQIRFPVEAAKYQDVLDALAEDDLPDEAHWLMDRAGPDDCGQLGFYASKVHKHVFAAGELSVHCSLSISGWIRSGLGIEADTSLSGDLGIIAGTSIRVGGSLRTSGEIRAGSRIDAGRNITAGEGISSAHAIVSGGDIRSGKGIDAGKNYDSMMNALEELPYQSDDSKKHLHVLQELWASFGGTQDYWDVVVSERGTFGLEAAGDIFAVTNINSAQAIRAGDSILTDGDIQAGRCIYAGGNAVAGRSINGGWNIEVTGMLKAGTDIDASSIDAKGGIEAGRDILFSWTLKSDRQIRVTGNIRASENSRLATIQSSFELCAGGDIWCTGKISAAKIVVGGDLFSCWSIRTDGDIIAGKAMEAGRGIASRLGNIRAGLGIKAGEAIQAAQSIQAGQEIVAGDDWGIFAATNLKVADWKVSGQVVAQQRPENLISGYWNAW